MVFWHQRTNIDIVNRVGAGSADTNCTHVPNDFGLHIRGVLQCVHERTGTDVESSFRCKGLRFIQCDQRPAIEKDAKRSIHLVPENRSSSIGDKDTRSPPYCRCTVNTGPHRVVVELLRRESDDDGIRVFTVDAFKLGEQRRVQHEQRTQLLALDQCARYRRS